MGSDVEAVDASGAVARRVVPATVESRAEFRPDTEGLRAVAVGTVVLLHAFAVAFTGGFISVDVFSVISGFLITTLLLREKAKTGRVSIQGFCSRRARRILPASALVVILTVIAAASKWTAVLAANIHFGANGTDYFGSNLAPSPLQHMWSLGVEEQFYVVWPALFLLLILTVRSTRQRHALAAILTVVTVASFTLSVTQAASDPNSAYFSPLTRAWELGLGALTAVLASAINRLQTRWVIEAIAAVGLIGILSSALLLRPAVPFPGSSCVARSQHRPGLRRGLRRPSHHRRPAIVDQSDAVARRPLRFAVPVALADPHHRRRTRRDLPPDVAELVSCDRRGSSDSPDVPLDRTPCAELQIPCPAPGISVAIGAALIVAQIAVTQVYIAPNGGSWNVFGSVTSAPTESEYKPSGRENI